MIIHIKDVNCVNKNIKEVNYMEYNIYVAEEDKSRFIATLEDLYKNNVIPFTYTIVDYVLESTYLYSYKISFTITCSEESLKKILYHSSIKNIVAICNSSKYMCEYMYRHVTLFKSLEIGEIIIERNTNTHDKLLEMYYKCNVMGIHSSCCYLYNIISDNTYIIRNVN